MKVRHLDLQVDYTNINDILTKDARFWGEKLHQYFENIDYKPESVLDFGCGQGDFIKNLKDIYPAADIQGLETGEKHGHSDITYYDGKNSLLVIMNLMSLLQSMYRITYMIKIIIYTNG